MFDDQRLGTYNHHWASHPGRNCEVSANFTTYAWVSGKVIKRLLCVLESVIHIVIVIHIFLLQEEMIIDYLNIDVTMILEKIFFY